MNPENTPDPRQEKADDLDLNYPEADLGTVTHAVKALVQDKAIPIDLIKKFQFVPLRQDGSALVVALLHPADLGTVDTISKALGMEVVAERATAKDISKALRQHFNINQGDWADLFIPGVPEASLA